MAGFMRETFKNLRLKLIFIISRKSQEMHLEEGNVQNFNTWFQIIHLLNAMLASQNHVSSHLC